MKKWITIVCLFLIVCQIEMKAAPHDEMKFKLLRKLSQVAEGDTSRLPILQELMKVTRSQPEVNLYYIDRLLQEAEAQKNNKYKCLAYLSRLHIAYNAYDAEGVKRWAAVLEPLARKEKLYDILFMCNRCTIDYLSFTEEYEQQEKAALKMLKEAQDLENDIGIIVACRCLSNVYLLTYRYEEGIESLERAFDLAVSIDQYSLAIETNNSLLDVYESLRDYPNWLKRIELQENCIKKITRLFPKEKSNFDGALLITYISRLNYHTRQNELTQAERTLQLAASLNKGQFGTAYDIRFHKACYAFYLLADQYDKALVETELLMSISKPTSFTNFNLYMWEKANTLYKLKRYDEALKLYKTVGVEKDSLQLSVLNKQTEHIRESYDTDTLMLKRERTNSYIQLSSLLLISILIALFIVFVIRAYRVRGSLRKSEKEMREMAQEMERMNLTKERFLSSISTGINEPLNVIVAGSLRIASGQEMDPAERKELSGVINSTSAHLMELINNILDLSRFESGMMKYSLSEIEVNSFVQSLVRSLATELPELKAELPVGQQITLETDVNKLSQLFMRLFAIDHAAASSARKELRLQLGLSEQGDQLSCCVYGTILVNNETQDRVVMNEINRLFVEHFGGTYRIVKPEGQDSFVKFVLPIKR